MSRKKKQFGPWGQRVDTLMSACGWGYKATAAKFSMGYGRLVSIVYGRANPTAAFLVKLAAFEGAYAREIEALKAGAIVCGAGPMRHTHRFNFLRGDQDRPEDLQALGASVACDSGQPFPPQPPKLVLYTPSKRRINGQNQKRRLGRSPDTGPGSPDVPQGAA